MLTFSIAPWADCVPATAFPDNAIAAGGTIDYDCFIDIDLTAERLLPAEIGIDWTISAQIGAGWSVQLMSPWFDEGEWGAPDPEFAQLGVTTTAPEALGYETESGETAVAGTLSLPFSVRLHRPACASDLPVIELLAGASASTPEIAGTAVVREGEQAEPLRLAPELAPIAAGAPVVTIEQVSVAPVSFSLFEQTTSGSMTIRIDNPVLQCQEWSVFVMLTGLAGDTPIGTVLLETSDPVVSETGNGLVAATGEPGAELASPTLISFLQPSALPGSYTQTIDFTLILPGQLSAGQFTLRAMASVELVAA